MGIFSVVIPWRDRPELRQTIASNARLFQRHGVEVVIINCGGDPADVSTMLRDQAISTLRHIVLPGAAFNWSMANNIGAMLSSRKFLFFLDADMTLRSDIFRQARPKLERGDCFIHVRAVRESRPKMNPESPYLKETLTILRLTFNDGQVARLVDRRGTDGSRCGDAARVLWKLL